MIAANEVLFEIPRKALLSASTSEFGKVKGAEPHRAALQKDGDQDEDAEDADGGDPAAAFGWAPLLFCMMAEYRRGEASPWAAYFGALPQPSQLPHPHFWPKDSPFLAATGLEHRLEDDAEKMRQQYDAYVGLFRASFPDAIPADDGALCV